MWAGLCLVSACGKSPGGSADAAPADVLSIDAALGAVSQQAYIKASNTDASDIFGTSIALSGDGSTLAVGAHAESSAANRIDGAQDDNSAPAAGAVYVFIRSGTTWSQQAYIKASNMNVGDSFGESVALSGDGSTLVVGATGEDSAATGIGGDESDNTTSSAGAAYVFTRSGTVWSQQAYIKASNPGVNDSFGASVALSSDGSTLAVSANLEDNAASQSGAVYLFARSGATWSQQAYLKASNPGTDDLFGTFVALSGDGSILAVPATGEDSDAIGIDGSQTNDLASQSGAVYVFARSGTTWSQQAYVKASNTSAGDAFGAGVALSGDGSTLAVGAVSEASRATGIGGPQDDDSAPGAGAVYVFSRSGTTWSQQAYVKASNTGAGDHFGSSVALSDDGASLAVGADAEASAAAGIDGNQASNSVSDAGAVYWFKRSGPTWSQQAYVKASNPNMFDGFGFRTALSGDGSTLAASAPIEASAARGVGGNQADNSAFGAGAVYVFREVQK